MGIKQYINNTISRLYFNRISIEFQQYVKKPLQSFDIETNILTGTVTLRNFEYPELIAIAKYSYEEIQLNLDLSPTAPSFNRDFPLSFSFRATLPKKPLNYYYELRNQFDKRPKISLTDSMLEKGISNSGLMFGPSGSGKSYLMNEMVESLIKSDHTFIVIDSDYLNPECKYFKSIPEAFTTTSTLPEFSLKSVLRIGDLAHSERIEELYQFLIRLFENQIISDNTFIIINCGDTILRRFSTEMINSILEKVKQKHLKLITSFQRTSDISLCDSVKNLASYCDRFFFTSDYLNDKFLAASLLLTAKAPIEGSAGYKSNSLGYFDAPYILKNIRHRKDVYFLGPTTKGFVGR